MKFSVVAIARNEAKTLPRLLGSLEKFKERGGEVVIVDTGSTDATVEVARSMGCHVVEVGEQFVIKFSDPNLVNDINARFIDPDDTPIVVLGDRTFDFAAARNFAASIALNDMIAMPDCDECYTSFNLDATNDLIAKGTSQFHYNFVFSHDEKGGRALQFLHSKFYNRKVLKWVGVTHEVLQPLPGTSVQDARVGEDTILLEHFQNVETQRGQYMKGLAFDCFQNPANDRNTHYLARELYYTGRYRSAIELFKKHVAMNGWQPEKARSMVFIGDCHQFLGDVKNAMVWWHRSFDEFPSREPLVRLADHYYRAKDFARTAAYAAAATAVPRPDAYFVQAHHYGPHPLYQQFWAHYWMGDRGRAKGFLEECLKLEPENALFKSDLAQFYP
jgi:tetratricopeptide (TPR) repeat protein